MFSNLNISAYNDSNGDLNLEIIKYLWKNN